jgi:hypothetical protein
LLHNLLIQPQVDNVIYGWPIPFLLIKIYLI